LNNRLHYHYTTVGHVTVDVLEDGSRRPGGTAFYSALQAARLGLRTLILTSGVQRELDELLEPYGHEFDVRVVEAEHTTTLLTLGVGAERRQRVLAWAGPIPAEHELDTQILHLAPVARELPAQCLGQAQFIGLTPQGLARQWSEQDGWIVPATPRALPQTSARPVDAIVVSEHERDSCQELIDASLRMGAVVAVTAGAQPTRLLTRGLGELEFEVPPLADAVDDLGAGDVFAAAFFIALHEGRDALGAAGFANAAAAVRMRARGAQAIGGRTQIEERLRFLAPHR
jgi:sugar/nucleoside kinase (ribokinase family)